MAFKKSDETNSTIDLSLRKSKSDANLNGLSNTLCASQISINSSKSEIVPPKVNINREGYNMPKFNIAFRRRSLFPDPSHKKPGKRDVLKSAFVKALRPKMSLSEMICSKFPIVKWLLNYKKDFLVADILTGITVCAFQVPESMGYSFIAKVDPVICLYSSFFPPLMYAICGTSRHISVGTVAAVALMTGFLITDTLKKHSIITRPDNSTLHFTPIGFVPGKTITYEYSAHQIGMSIAFLCGIYQLLFHILRFGFISVYMSEQLINGFTSAVAYHVLVAQLKHLLGVEVNGHNGPLAFIYTIIDVCKQLENVNYVALVISILCIGILCLFKFYLNGLIVKKTGIKIPFPIEIFVVIGGIVISQYIHLHSVHQVDIVGPIPLGFPEPQLPSFALLKEIWASSLALSIVAFTLTYSVGKTFAYKYSYELDSNQELFALGASNLFSCFFSCIPIGSSLSRSALQESCGGKTQLVNLVSCAGLLLVLLAMGYMLEQLPIAVLASIICIALRGLLLQVLDFKKFWRIDRIDASIWLVTFLSVIILDIDLGLYVGFCYSLLTLIYKSQRPRCYMLGTVGHSDVYVPIKRYVSAEELPGIKIYQFCGPLHFANQDYFRDLLATRAGLSLKEIKTCRKKQINEQTTKAESEKEDKLKSKIAKRLKPLFSSTNSLASLAHNSSPTHLIIDCTLFSYVDTAGVKVLARTVKEYEEVGIKTLLASCPSHVTKIFEKESQFYSMVPAQNVFITVHDAVQVAQLEQKGLESVSESIENKSILKAPTSNNNVNKRESRFIVTKVDIDNV